MRKTTNYPNRWSRIEGNHMSSLVLGVIVLLLGLAPVGAGEVTFEDLATDPTAGLEYRRGPSETLEIFRQLRAQGSFTVFQLEETPNKWRGAPGVVVFDHDEDGDLDLYVTNGPGRDNGLFSNQLVETGETRFLDVAVAAGVAAYDLDSSGACSGDIDNDGDRDLLVLSAHDANRLFENQGDGSFLDITGQSGLGDVVTTSVGCSFGDIDGDGLLDVVVANNTVSWQSMLGIGPTDAFAFNQPNLLYRNLSGNQFEDVSESSGLRQLTTLPFEGAASVTWAIAMVDYDLDGDLDILHADDQGGVLPESLGGVDRGVLFLLQNDGTGHFTDVTAQAGLKKPGGWMGLSFSDLNADGYLDFFATNVGDWGQTTLTPLDPVWGDFFPYELGDLASRWYLGGPGGTFSDPGVGPSVVATPFGWGTSMFDYDNDGDSDIVYHGGLAMTPFVNSGNPGVILANDGEGNMSYDLEALAGSTNHRRRVVQGVAIGDLDGNGFDDIVSVSSTIVQESIPLMPFGVHWGSPIDGIPAYQKLCIPTGIPGVWVFDAEQEENEDGTLSVELSSGNGNRWVKIEVLGTVGLTTEGRVNRDGIGAVVSFEPHRGRRAMRPVLGGASYASQDSLELTFGLGRERFGTAEVLWPGGVRNRLYGVSRGERVTLPEIPCSFDTEASFGSYFGCVRGALRELENGGVIDRRTRSRLFTSALLAYLEENH